MCVCGGGGGVGPGVGGGRGGGLMLVALCRGSLSLKQGRVRRRGSVLETRLLSFAEARPHNQWQRPWTLRPPNGGVGCRMSLSCLESQGYRLIPLFYLRPVMFFLCAWSSLLFLFCHVSANGPFS